MDGWTYDELHAENLWGPVYEVFTGESFEREGYSVVYRGATLGYVDGGIDLVASKGSELLFLQCKHGKIAGRQRIETMLYAASSFLHGQYAGDRLQFRIVVPSISAAFAVERRVKGRVDVDLRWYRYLMSKNDVQKKVRIEVLELPMPIDA